MSEYVTPSFPDHAMRRGAAWQREHRQPVFARVFAKSADGCKNCCGSGLVYLSFASAFLHDSPRIIAAGKSIGEKGERKIKYSPTTYFDGDGEFGKGWYAIDETVPFDCPLCGGDGKAR